MGHVSSDTDLDDLDVDFDDFAEVEFTIDFDDVVIVEGVTSNIEVTLVGGLDFVTAEGCVVVEPAVDFDDSLVGGVEVESIIDFDDFVLVEGVMSNLVTLVGGVVLLVA